MSMQSPCCAGKIHQTTTTSSGFWDIRRPPSDVKELGWANDPFPFGFPWKLHAVTTRYPETIWKTHNFLCMNFLFFRAIEMSSLIWSWHHRKHLTYLTLGLALWFSMCFFVFPWSFPRHSPTVVGRPSPQLRLNPATGRPGWHPRRAPRARTCGTEQHGHWHNGRSSKLKYPLVMSK